MGARRFIQRIPLWGKILIGLFLLLVLGVVGVNIYLKSLVNKRLREMVYESSNGLYRLSYTNVSINALTGNLTIRNAELAPDTAVFAQLSKLRKAPRFLISGKTEKLSIRRVQWMKYMNSKELNIGKLLIREPRFQLTQYRLKKDTADRSSGIYEFLSKHLQDLKIDAFRIDDAVIRYQVTDTLSQVRAINDIEHLSLGFTDIHFTGQNKERRLAAEEYYVRLKEYRYRTTDSLYWLGISGFNYSSNSKLARLDSFFVEPVYKPREFSKRVQYQQTQYEMRLEDIAAEEFDMSAFVEGGEAIVPNLRIRKGDINIHIDRSLPLSPEDKPNVVLSQKILNLGFPFAIQTMNVGKIALRYNEFNPLSDQTALIAFDDISGKVTNITTLPEFIERNGSMKVDLTASFLNAGVKAVFDFDLAGTEGKFMANLRVNQIDADRLNPILVPIAKIEARKGVVKELDALVTGDANRATANVKLLYHGLKINVLKMEGDSLERKGIKTMFANLFIIDDNPKDGVLRTATRITQKRRLGKSFFNMLWSSVSTGIQQIILKKNGLKI